MTRTYEVCDRCSRVVSKWERDAGWAACHGRGVIEVPEEAAKDYESCRLCDEPAVAYVEWVSDADGWDRRTGLATVVEQVERFPYCLEHVQTTISDGDAIGSEPVEPLTFEFLLNISRSLEDVYDFFWSCMKHKGVYHPNHRKRRGLARAFRGIGGRVRRGG